jgi:hypothetical protein
VASPAKPAERGERGDFGDWKPETENCKVLSFQAGNNYQKIKFKNKNKNKNKKYKLLASARTLGCVRADGFLPRL